MPLQPILSSLRKHRLTAFLLSLQVALACAILCNAGFLIALRVERMGAISGLDEKAVSVVQVSDPQDAADTVSTHAADLVTLRAIAGVESAAIVSNLPLSGNQSAGGGCASLEAMHAARLAKSVKVPGCAEPDEYDGGTQVIGTLGLKLVAGRDFRADEFVAGKANSAASGVPAVIISEALAKDLYPHGALGRSLYFGAEGFHGKGTPVVGVVAHLGRGAVVAGVSNDRAIVLPVEPADSDVQFVIRSLPRDRSRVMRAAIAALARRVPNRQVSSASSQTYEQLRAAYFRHDTTMISLLLASALGLLFVTGLGIAGLASFWVQQRIRSIGIRRAVGARRGDILRYFQVENFLIVGSGIVPGLLLAVALNLLLMKEYELPRLPLFYLPIGGLSMWLLGQLAVLSPALRAASVPPVVATRSL